MFEKFHGLPQEKQELILESAMKVFGAVSYKKASIRDIAADAGISKALIFHYFGTKKALYLYLIHYAFDRIKEAYAQGEDGTVMDFFDRVRLATDIKMSLIARHPALMQFSISAYYETDPEVAGELQELSAMGAGLRSDFVLSDVDRQKFKDSVAPDLVLELLVGYAKGRAESRPVQIPYDFSSMLRQFSDILDMLKTNFYKEEFLNESRD